MNNYMRRFNINQYKENIKNISKFHALMHPCNPSFAFASAGSHAGALTSIIKNLILLFLSFTILSPLIHSQQSELSFEHFSVDEGMPTVTNYILQDRTGYLWFATNSGLYKYDGYSFLSYKRDFDNTMSVLYEDKDGIIWIGSPFGLDKFDPISEKFSHFTPNPNDTIGNKINEVLAICEDKFGALWIGTNYGLYKFDRKNAKFTLLLHDSTDPGSIASNCVGAFCRDKQGSLWLGTKAGLDKFDYNTRKFEHCYNDPNEKDEAWYESFSSYWINDIIEDEKGILLLGTNGGLIEFNSKSASVINHLNIPSEYIHRIASISQDALSGSIWMSTTQIVSTSELFSFDKNSKKFTRYSSKGNCILSERSGTIWIGTDIGIKKLNRIKKPFKNYPLKDIVYSIKKGREDIIWTFSLVPIIDWKQFDYTKEQFLSVSFGGDRLLFVFNSGADLLFRSNNGIAYSVDTIGEKYLLGHLNDNLINSASSVWKGSKGYWIGTEVGDLLFYDFRIKKLNKIRKFKESVDYIFEDSRGMLWVAISMGKVYCYRQEGDSIAELISIIKIPIALHGRTVNEIAENKMERILFATTSGLEIYDRSTETISRFTEKDGLPSSNIKGILEDNHGFLWLNTPNGISKFDPETKQFKNYDASYGLKLAMDSWLGIGCKTSNGEMFFPSALGFTRFHPDSIKDNPFIPPIVITSFKKFDKPYPISNEISLPFDQNFISIEYAALSYISPERNQYAYMMEGLDKDWVYAGTRRFASYPNLDPGEYVFRVKGSNNDGIWNEAGTSISIIISPPWWKTTWAYILYSILILSIIYTTWKMQLRRIRIGHEYEMSKFEAEKLHEVDELKSRFFANISHEFRTPLTLILGPANDIIDNTKETKTKQTAALIKRNAGRLLGLVNQLLDLSKVEAGKMKLETREQNIIPLLKGLTLSFSSLAERRETTLRFNTIEERLNVFLDKDKIEKIVNNILSNACKFTPEGGKVDVTVEKMIKEVEIRISDSGKGISTDHIGKIFDRFYQADGSRTREQEGTGIGLALTKELVEIHKGKIRVESETGKGTTFIVSIPLGKEHLKPEEIVEVQGAEAAEYVIKETELVLEPENRKEKSDIDEIMEIELSADKTGKPLLLIVEDNPDVRKYIIGHLEDNYRIQEAFDGEDGLKQAINHIPDLIISDVMMPKMDGFQLCNKLKTDERTSHIPIIMLTAKATSQDKIAGYETGADDYIMKPFESDELLARIKNLIEQRKKLREHFRKEGLIGLEDKNINSTDKKFLKKSIEIINTHMADTGFSVDNFADEVGMSRSQLHRKLISFIGESPGDLTRRIRLSKAAKLIEQKFGNISEVAWEVGFSNPANFAQSFKKQFGVSPSEYEQRLNP